MNKSQEIRKSRVYTGRKVEFFHLFIFTDERIKGRSEK